MIFFEKKTKIAIFFILVIFLFIWLANFTKPISNNPEEIVFFEIKRGDGLVDIAQSLESEGIIKSRFAFLAYVIFSQKQSRLQAGVYELKPSLDVFGVAQKIFLGETSKIRITIPEGWRVEEIASFLDGFDGFDGDLFVELSFGKYDFDFLENKPDELSVEGFLFPDTYFLEYHATEKDLIIEMLSNFDKKLTFDLREEIKNKNKTIFEIVTMASLIEKEVRSFEDKRNVSDVLWKRIQINMPLQVDATIAYITKKRTTRISIAETRIESPYNTYINRGLPIGPISNPGIESIKAAINPKSNDFFFYLSTLEGETIFSRNLDEHNVAKNKYLKQ